MFYIDEYGHFGYVIKRYRTHDICNILFFSQRGLILFRFDNFLVTDYTDRIVEENDGN